MEFLVYGRKALDINRREIEELRRLGVAVFINVDKDFGLGPFADVVIEMRGDEAAVYSSQGRALCHYETDPAPRLVC